MPRDDLSIDFAPGYKYNMPQAEQLDAAGVLDDWINRVANLPHEVAFMQDEIADKDRQMQECLMTIQKHDATLQKFTKSHGGHTSNPKEPALRKIILENYDKAERLQDEKLALAAKTEQLVDKHTRQLDIQIKSLQDRNEFPRDSDLPSILHSQQPERPRIEATSATMPLGQIINAANSPHTRQPSHSRLSITANLNQTAGATASAPATPAATLLLQRQARESSLGAVKRPRLTGGLGTVPAASSGLARHASLTPGTPRGGTPSAVRGGSAGPRNTQKKKVAPQGSRQSGAPRKGKPGKSGLGRVKRGVKGSPASANDSELSDDESGSIEEDDESGTGAGRDRDGDHDMADVDDDEGSDDKKYCICHSISYGDMVACDNTSCEFEWFHWACVGVKSEPQGVWVCPVCTANAQKMKK